MRHSIALLTVFYPSVESYLKDFLSSLQQQTCKDFDLIIINDGFTNNEYKRLFTDLSIVELKSEQSISKNREYGIKYVKEKGYQYLILCDADDYFSEYRVEVSVNNLEDNDIVVNDIAIVSSQKKLLIDNYFSKSLLATSDIDLSFIKEKNVLGFSNTGLRLDSLWDISLPSDLKIVDWYFYTILLEHKLKVKYVPIALTFYRQHSDNLIGIDNFSLNLFKEMLSLKIAHYNYLSEINSSYRTLFIKYSEMRSASDMDILLAINKNKKNNNFPLWWENIKL